MAQVSALLLHSMLVLVCSALASSPAFRRPGDGASSAYDIVLMCAAN